MPITVTCDECSESHWVRDDSVGKQFKCKGCGKRLLHLVRLLLVGVLIWLLLVFT